MVQSIILNYPNSSRTIYSAPAESSKQALIVKEFAENVNQLTDMLLSTALLQNEYQIEIKIKPRLTSGVKAEPVFEIMDSFFKSNRQLFSIMRQLVEKKIFPEAQALEKLSPKQRKIAGLVRKGLSYTAIAEKLCISKHTVNGHRKNAMKVLGVSNSRELTAFLERFDRE